MDYEIQRAILGALMKDNALWDTVCLHKLTANSFSEAKLGRIFSEIETRLKAGQTADVVSVATALEDVAPDIFECDGYCPTVVNFPDWVCMLKDAEVRRNLKAKVQSLCNRIDGSEATADIVKELYSTAETANQGLQVGGGTPSLGSMAKHVLETCINRVPERIPFLEDCPTVFLTKGDFFTIGGSTGSGKTALAVAAAVAQLKAGYRVLYVCTESPAVDIFKRFAACISGVPHYLPERTPEVLGRFEGAMNTLSEKCKGKLTIVGSNEGAITPHLIERKLKSLESVGIPDIVYVDFIQNLSADRQYRARLEEVNAIIHTLHDIVSRYGVAMVLLSQFNRSSQSLAEQNGNSLPSLIWLKDTSNLEQLSAEVAFMYRPKKEPRYYFYSAKNRNCKPFKVFLKWAGTKYCYDGDVAPVDPKYAPPVKAEN